MMRSFVIALSTTMLLGASCPTSTDPRLVALYVGESATVSTDARLVFEGVGQDSRCPSDAVCVWAGNAEVKLAVMVGKRMPFTQVLNSFLDPRSFSQSGKSITLVAVDPAPTTTAPIDPAKYVVTLRIE